MKKGYTLWCEGLDGILKRPHESDGVVYLDEEYSTGKPLAKKDQKSAFEERKHAVQGTADTLHDKHGRIFNIMVQYKLCIQQTAH